MESLWGRVMIKKKYVYSIGIVFTLVSIIVSCIIIENTYGIEDISDSNVNKIVINEVLSDNNIGLKDGDNEYNDWIEIYNYGEDDVNLEGFGLSDDVDKPFKWKFPNVTIKSKSFIVVIASGKNKKDSDNYLHTNFNINKKGDQIILTDSKKNQIDYLKIPKLSSDISYGRTNKFNEYAVLSTATPGKINTRTVLEVTKEEKELEEPIFSKQGGFYSDNIKLELSTKDKDTKIYYTLDGSDPNISSYLYKEPIEISSREGEKNSFANIKTSERYNSVLWQVGEDEVYKGTVVRARTYKDGVFSNEIITNTYFINPDYTMPIISLVTDEENLFGYEDGIYIPGKIYDVWKANNKGLRFDYSPVPTNYNQTGKEWERKANIEMFETNGKRVINQGVGVRIAGGWSRLNYCKSLRIYARDEYSDKNTIDYDIFQGLTKNESDENLSVFKTLLLRNGGNDYLDKTMFKEALMQNIIEDIGLDTQAYRPAILFINGEYWGIHNIRENFDEYYFQGNYGIDKDDVVVLTKAQTQDKLVVDIGEENDIRDYNDMIDYIEENDMSNEENYEYIKTKMDVDNFIKYTISQIYFDNTDWPQNNVKVWRNKNSSDDDGYRDGIWRWMIFDTDRGFIEYDNNSLEHALNAKYKDFINYNYIEVYGEELDLAIDEDAASKNCIPLKKLLENKEFKKQFIDTFELYLDTIFNEEVVIEKIERMASVIRPEIQEHHDRWKLKETRTGDLINNIRGRGDDSINFNDEVDKLIDFAKKRPKYIQTFLKELN